MTGRRLSLILALVIFFFSANAQAAGTIPVVVKLLPGINLSVITNLLGGTILAFVPHLPRPTLSPDVVFLVFIPPLLYWSALNTSWRDFRWHAASEPDLRSQFLRRGLVCVQEHPDHRAH